jgi:hypothetical protein
LGRERRAGLVALLLFALLACSPGSAAVGERADGAADRGSDRGRLELLRAYEAEGRRAPAFYQAAWLYFLGEEDKEREEAGRYLRQPRVRAVFSGLRELPESVQLTLVALEAGEKLTGSALRGSLAGQRESVRLMLSRAAVRAGQAERTTDPVALAARAHCLLAADLGGEAIFWPEYREGRAYLRQAVSLAEQLTRRLPENSRAWGLLALARERLARATGNWELTAEAAAACEQALSRRESASMRFALNDLRGKLGERRDPSSEVRATASSE